MLDTERLSEFDDAAEQKEKQRCNDSKLDGCNATPFASSG
jgi:hypothetical protein